MTNTWEKQFKGKRRFIFALSFRGFCSKSPVIRKSIMAVRVCEQNCSPQGGRDGEGEERERDVGLERERKVISRGTQRGRTFTFQGQGTSSSDVSQPFSRSSHCYHIVTPLGINLSVRSGFSHFSQTHRLATIWALGDISDLSRHTSLILKCIVQYR